jgi:hypothetical protein
MNKPNGITIDESGNIIAEGPEGVMAYDILSMRAALRLEIRTGMVMRNGYSLVQACIKRGYVPAGVRTKKAAYVHLDRLAASLPGQSPKPL